MPQVREGSLWMREAINNVPSEFSELSELITTHANEEQYDFKVLYEDYLKVGGTKRIEELKRNPGGEALNSFMYAKAKSRTAYGLLGGIFIIEGTGQKIIPTLLPLIKKSLNVQLGVFKFLEYHGENDIHHLNRWLTGMELCHMVSKSSGDEIISTAKAVSDIYSLQWELIES